MDPDATVTVMLDASRPLLERFDAAMALLDWLNGGGFLPDGWSEDDLITAVNEVVAEYHDETFSAR